VPVSEPEIDIQAARDYQILFMSFV